MDPSNETRDTTSNSAYNPFPEPQTIPAGWDMSEFTVAPQPDSVMDTADSAEG